jgi:hypothetical protein
MPASTSGGPSPSSPDAGRLLRARRAPLPRALRFGHLTERRLLHPRVAGSRRPRHARGSSCPPSADDGWGVAREPGERQAARRGPSGPSGDQAAVPASAPAPGVRPAAGRRGPAGGHECTCRPRCPRRGRQGPRLDDPGQHCARSGRPGVVRRGRARRPRRHRAAGVCRLPPGGVATGTGGRGSGGSRGPCRSRRPDCACRCLQRSAGLVGGVRRCCGSRAPVLPPRRPVAGRHRADRVRLARRPGAGSTSPSRSPGARTGARRRGLRQHP